jgi:acyl carrier protein
MIPIHYRITYSSWSEFLELDDEMKDLIARYIAEEVLKDADRKIASDEVIISSGLIDSFSLVDLALYIEETFNVRIDDAELSADVFDTIDALVELIQARQGGS